MASNWPYVPLSELTENPVTYGVVQPGKNLPAGLPMLRVNNFRGHSLDLSEVMRIAPEIEAKYERTRIQAGDVLITIVGSVGQVAIVSNDLNDWNIARAIAMIRPKEPGLSRWIALVLRSPFAQYQLGAAANTTVQTTINLKDLRKFQIPFPAEDERLAIAHILGTLDDKIELNRRQNETLEAMARALFKAWFVDFEPARAKMDGRWQRGQSLPGLPAHLYDLFPDRLVESELGLIPEGWSCTSLDEVANFLNGLALQKFRPDEGDVDFLPVLKIAQLRKGFTDGKEKASIKIKPEYIVNNGDVIFSWSGSLLVDIWCGGKAALNQHLFKVTSDKYPKWLFYCFTNHHLMEFQRIASYKAVTMGHIKRSHLKEALCAIPPENLLIQANPIMEGLVDKSIETRLEGNTLAQIRDTLLPKLISGELRVPDAERIVGATV